MGVEVADSGLAQVSVEAGSGENGSLVHEKENGQTNQGSSINEPITFGSHGVDELAKGEVKNAPETNFPRNAVDEWPAPKQIHYFHVIKFRSYEDPKVKAKQEQIDKNVQKTTQNRSQFIEKLRGKRAERAEIIAQMRALNEENNQFWSILDEKKKEMEPLHQALGKLKEKGGGGLCSSEKELNDLIKSLQFRIQHESIPLTEEKQILREIKQLEGTREKVIANADARAQIQKSMGEKQSIQDQVKLMGVDLNGVRKDHQVVKLKRTQLKDQKEAIDKEISALEQQLDDMTQKRDEGYKTLHDVRKQRDEGNACYYQNRTLLNKAKELAAKKEIEALKVLCDTEVDKFMSQWSNSKAFREDYERRILPSLDFRQLSRDGRMRNSDEKPLVSATPSGVDAVAKPDVKRAKENSTPPQNDSSATQKAPKEVNIKVQKEMKSKPRGSVATSEPLDLEDKEGISVEVVEKVEKVRKEPLPKEKDVDEAKLREMKREEEIAKAKLAMERKKKLAEKAAAKAALKAQKEAEKKLKDREKKAKKKAGASGSAPDSEEPTEQTEAEVDELEKTEVKVEAPLPSKNKDRKETSIRQRGRAKGSDSLAKVILKRKKSTNYWLWAAPAAVAVVMLLVLGYTYLL